GRVRSLAGSVELLRGGAPTRDAAQLPGVAHMSDRPSRRRVLKSLVSGAAATVAASAAAGGAEPVAPVAPDAPVLALTDFQPKSMLHVPVTQVPRAKFPVIDVHTHLSFAAKHHGGVAMGERVNLAAARAGVVCVRGGGIHCRSAC